MLLQLSRRNILLLTEIPLLKEEFDLNISTFHYLRESHIVSFLYYYMDDNRIRCLALIVIFKSLPLI